MFRVSFYRSFDRSKPVGTVNSYGTIDQAREIASRSLSKGRFGAHAFKIEDDRGKVIDVVEPWHA